MTTSLDGGTAPYCVWPNNQPDSGDPAFTQNRHHEYRNDRNPIWRSLSPSSSSASSVSACWWKKWAVIILSIISFLSYSITRNVEQETFDDEPVRKEGMKRAAFLETCAKTRIQFITKSTFPVLAELRNQLKAARSPLLPAIGKLCRSWLNEIPGLKESDIMYRNLEVSYQLIKRSSKKNLGWLGWGMRSLVEWWWYFEPCFCSGEEQRAK